MNKARRYHLTLVGFGIAILLWTASTLAGFSALNRAETQAGLRKQDLVAACLRTSARTAADVNLNWAYYESEIRLAYPAPLKVPKHLTANERLLLTLTRLSQKDSGNPGRKDLIIRADADYNAAYVKARSVDYHQADLVQVKSGFGFNPTPRNWVLKAHYSCRKAF